MKLANIKQGQTIKNYKELCRLLNEPIKGGAAKRAQIKIFNCYFRFHKDGNKLIIDEMYSEIKVKADLRHNGNNYYDIPQYRIDKKYNNKNGVYKITKDNTMYIGSTTQGFRRRFIQHYDKNNIQMYWTRDLLRTGGTYELLWMASDNDTIDDIRKMEYYYIGYYKSLDNITLINSKGLIENKYKPKKHKKYSTVRISLDNYEKALKLLKENNLLY